MIINPSRPAEGFFGQLNGLEKVVIKQIVPATYIFMFGILFGERVGAQSRSLKKTNTSVPRFFYYREFQVIATSLVCTSVFLIKMKSITIIVLQIIFVAGTILGFLDSAKTHLNKVDQFLNSSIVELSNNLEINSRFHSCLVIRYEDLKEVDFRALGCAILSRSSKRPIREIAFIDSSFDDDDLVSLIDLGTFKDIYSLRICNNKKITGEFLKSLDVTKVQNLIGLDLSNTSITPYELLAISELDWFKKITFLRLNGNSQLANLENPWWENDNFSYVKSLGLSDTGMSEKVLDALISNSIWVRNLEGLNLLKNPIKELPNSIWALTKLKEAELPPNPAARGYWAMPDPAQEHGLLIPGSAMSNLKTQELISRGLQNKIRISF